MSVLTPARPGLARPGLTVPGLDVLAATRGSLTASVAAKATLTATVEG